MRNVFFPGFENKKIKKINKYNIKLNLNDIDDGIL